ncbi:MAG: triose-phosphate isomerase [Gemmatimonadetes bacterium RBG_16_66_8]|nr:MAG: triose-phosphate isomerase [Gemmatimonadetes bacterium RBG_16_66_8]
MKPLLFAANWKMHQAPAAAREFLGIFLNAHAPVAERQVWFFPPAVSLVAVVDGTRGRRDLLVGVQNVYWEPRGAFTGEISAGMARDAGARAVLVGHSERRHVFGETDEQTAKKVKAALDGELTPILCVGEQLAEREARKTVAVVERQLAPFAGWPAEQLARLVIAYEPVWAIGTGRNATPQDAAEVHAAIRSWFESRGVAPHELRVLYGGSVNRGNVAALVAEPEINGVLVGGASLDPAGWAAIVRTGV